MMLYFLLVASLCRPSLAAADVIVLEQEGDPFVCFTPDDAKKILQMRLDMPLLDLKIQKLEESNMIRGAELEKMQMSNDDLVAKLIDQRAMTARIEEELNKKQTWYTHPVFWAFAGFVLGGITYFVLDSLVTENEMGVMSYP